MSATLAPLRWWHLERVLALEVELFGPDAWSAGVFWSELAQVDTCHYLVMWDGPAERELVGYAGLSASPPEASVQTIGVRADHRRRGLGAALLRALLTEAVRRGVPRVGLEVRADDPVAQHLYHRFGFRDVGRRRGYYQPSGADAVVMVRDARAAAGEERDG